MKRSPMNRGTSQLKRSPFKRQEHRPLNPHSGEVVRKGMKRSKGKPATATEKAYMGRVARAGCIVCRNLGFGETPCELHHPRFLAGGGQRASHMDVIGLCPRHHRLGGWGVAYHMGPEEFERRYGTEKELLDQTKREMGFIQPEEEMAA